jgi:serine/threonine-protein kinase HipA
VVNQYRMKMTNCLYCYKPLENNLLGDYIQQCRLDFFDDKQPPEFEHSLQQMAELAKNVVDRSVAVPDVQPKLSLSIVNDSLQDGTKGRLTIVGAL